MTIRLVAEECSLATPTLQKLFAKAIEVMDLSSRKRRRYLRPELCIFGLHFIVKKNFLNGDQLSVIYLLYANSRDPSFILSFLERHSTAHQNQIQNLLSY